MRPTTTIALIVNPNNPNAASKIGNNVSFQEVRHGKGNDSYCNSQSATEDASR
jgi:hypothetical protein